MIEETQALDAFGALSQATRLQMVRALVVAGPAGMAAGAVGDAVGASSSSASFHLAHLERAGLVTSRRESRSIIYAANYDGLSGLVEFLMGHEPTLLSFSAATGIAPEAVVAAHARLAGPPGGADF